MKKRILFTVVAFCIVILSGNAKVIVPAEWKFITGDNGLYGGPVELTGRGNPDLITLGAALSETEMIIKGSPDVEIPVSLRSDFRRKYRGILLLSVVTDFGEDVAANSR
jgi:hypothetical protein